jgi:ADP-heptose:LPS heptosyltransferase
LEDVERRTARLSLADAAGLFTQASAVLGADSGPLHLAAALGAPSLLFYLATDPGVWRPIGPRAGIVDCRELWGAAKNEAELEARALAALRALL